LVAGATFVLQFAFNLGQETGCTAIGVGLMVYGLLPDEEDGRVPRSMVLAAVGVALVASAREYGWAWAGVGLAVAVRQSIRDGRGWRNLRSWLWLMLPAWWYARTWWRSGNPWLSLPMGGMFDVNPVFLAWMEHYRELYGATLQSGAGWRDVAVLVGRTALPACLGVVAGAVVFWRRPGWGLMMAVTLATAFCWWLSVPYTGGGPFYSLRVLSPLLLLGCVWGGGVLAKVTAGHAKVRLGVVVLLAGVGMDASLRALTVPQNPWKTPPGQWLMAGYRWQQENRQEKEPLLAQLETREVGRVLSDSAGLQADLRRRGIQLEPLWSPVAAPLFGLGEGDVDPVEWLCARGFTHLLVKRSEITAQFLQDTGALARLEGRLQGVWANDTYMLFALSPTDQ
jgi:hypothetical protein